jgi:hypothetical protein
MGTEDDDKHRENRMGTEDEDKHRENRTGTEDEDKQSSSFVPIRFSLFLSFLYHRQEFYRT